MSDAVSFEFLGYNSGGSGNFFVDVLVEKAKKAEEIAIKQAARAIGGEAAGFAKENCPVDTGLLRNSITFALSGEAPAIASYSANSGDGSGSYSGTIPAEKEVAIYIGTNVKYAMVQENGDFKHKTGSSHFLKNAITDNGDRYKQLLEAALKTTNVV